MAAKSSGPPVSGSHSAGVTDVNGHVQLTMGMPKIYTQVLILVHQVFLPSQLLAQPNEVNFEGQI